jgi:hypothetical protein
MRQHQCAAMSAARVKIWFMRDLFEPLPPSRADKHALEWQQNIDSTAMVGKRHHNVPHFHLSRFANTTDQLLVRDRVTGKASIRSAGDMAVKDFNTFINTAGEKDSSFETLYGEIESAAADVLRRHLDIASFVRPRPFSFDERIRLDTYISTQHTRGMRTRRIQELLADYTTKLLNQVRLSPEQIEGYEFAPHQNDHLRAAAMMSERVHAHLSQRSLRIVHLDTPMLLIGDEPVLVFGKGLVDAEFILVPVSPTARLAYGPVDDRTNPTSVRLRGVDAVDLTKEANDMTIRVAVGWVAAHPEHPTLRGLHWPVPEPMVRVEDGGSPMGTQLNAANHRPPRRLSK